MSTPVIETNGRLAAVPTATISFRQYVVVVGLSAVLLFMAACGAAGQSVNLAVPPDQANSTSAAMAQANKPVSVPGAFPLLGGVPLNVHLFDAGSYDPDGEIVEWEWNFGDAVPGEPAWHDYTASKGDTWHWYRKPGTKVAHLRVTDDDGNKDVAHVKIEMREGNNANPVAVANAEPSYGYTPLGVSFSPAGSYDPDGEIIQWEWDFEDGLGFQDYTVSAGTATQDYTAAGDYTAVLRVTDDDGAVSTDGVGITVLPPTPFIDGLVEVAGLSPSLAFGPDGMPSVSYHSAGPSYDLKYAHWNGTSWAIELVEDLPENSDVFDGTSLAFDAGGEPTISYLHHVIPSGFNGKLWFASRSGGPWSTEQIPDSDAVGQFSSLKYDSHGYPVIAYHQYIPFSGGVKLVRWNGTGWEVTHVDSNPGEVGGIGVSLALDALDRPHVSYGAGGGQVGQGELRYAYNDGTGWSYDVVDTGIGGSWPWSLICTSLALDAAGRPYIAYRDAITMDLKYARSSDSGWQTEIVQSAGDIGYWCSSVLSEEGAAYVSYHDMTSHSVKLAASTSAGAWTITVVDSGLGSVDAGQDTYNSLALDPAGIPAVVYYDAANGDLKYALCN